MNYFSTVQKIVVPKKFVESSNKFAKGVIYESDYSDQNQTNLIVRRKQSFSGKLGEFAVYIAFRKYTEHISAPNCVVYKRGSHSGSWEKDVTIDGELVLIKCVTETARQQYRHQFVFTRNGDKKDDLLKNPNIDFCGVLYDNLAVTTNGDAICYVCPIVKARSLTFHSPELSHLQGTKLTFDVPILTKFIENKKQITKILQNDIISFDNSTLNKFF